MQNLRASFQRIIYVLPLTLAFVCLSAAHATPKPEIKSLSPSSANAGGPAFTLTIKGENFASGAKAAWNAVGLVTKFKSTKELTATVPASLISKKGSATITVTVDKVKSAGMIFTIKPPKPVLSSLTPDTAIAGGPGFTLSVKGKNFLAGAKVKWGTTALVTTFKSAALLTAPEHAS